MFRLSEKHITLIRIAVDHESFGISSKGNLEAEIVRYYGLMVSSVDLYMQSGGEYWRDLAQARYVLLMECLRRFGHHPMTKAELSARADNRAENLEALRALDDSDL